MSDCSALELTLSSIDVKVTELNQLTKNRLTTLEQLVAQLTGKPLDKGKDSSGVQARLARLESRLSKIEQQLSANNKPSSLEARIRALESFTKQTAAAFETTNFILQDHFKSIKVLNDSTNQLTLTEQQIIEAFKKLTKGTGK